MSDTSTATASTTLRDMWATRPVRLPSDQGGKGKIAGVCEGIGVRYNIDPIIVRVLFVIGVLFANSTGIALYLLAWAFMPRYSLPISPAEALFGNKNNNPQLRKERNLGIALLIGFLIFSCGSGGTFTTIFIAPAFIAYLVFFGAWYFLHTQHPTPPAGLLIEKDTKMDVNRPEDLKTYLSTLQPVDGFTAPYSPSTPPAWDPLGVAPFAWDLPEPTPVVQEKPKKKKRNPFVVIIAGIVAVCSLGTMGIIIAAGMSEGDGGSRSGVGDQHYVATRATDLQDHYSAGVGSFNLNLQRLEPLPEDKKITIDTGVGDTDVYLPSTMPVTLTCTNGIGDTNCIAGTYNSKAQGKTLTIDLKSGVGTTTIHYPEEQKPAGN